MKLTKKNEKLIFLGLFIFLFCGFLGRYYVMGYGVGSGGDFYYAQVVSLVLDGDINLLNQMDDRPYLQSARDEFMMEEPVPPVMLENGYVRIGYSVGPAVFWMPFFVAGHLLVLVLNLFGFNMLTNGYSHIHQIFSMFGSILYATIGLYLTYRFASKFYKKNIALISTLAIAFGGTAVQYIMVEPSISHGLSIFVVACFLTYFYENRNNNSIKKWATLGLIGGFMMLVRWQEGFFMFIPLAYFIRDFFQHKNQRLELIFKGLLFVLIVLFAFSPQMVIWKILHGSFFQVSPAAVKIMNFSQPEIFGFLFGFRHSLLVSTPIVLMAIFGLPFYIKKEKMFGSVLLLVLLVFIYINSSLVGFGGTAFGARRMTDFVMVFSLFLAALLSKLKESKVLWIAGLFIIAVLIIFNLIYMLEYDLNLINRFDPITYGKIIRKAPQIAEVLARTLF